eukprot:m.63779 g.63779  ORF g.63779 m.63779 type:complete len:306 (+) comp11600_c0_seq1:414-1331(+)
MMAPAQYATLAYIAWGLLPLYYQFLPAANIPDLLCLRSALIFPLILFVESQTTLGRQKSIIAKQALLFSDLASLGFCVIAGLIQCISWYAFTWAMTHGHVLEASLGFFITPVFAVFLGIVFLNESLSSVRVLSVTLSVLSITFQVWSYGVLPWISIVMATFFALYSLCKKFVKYDPMMAIVAETMVLFPFAVLCLIANFAIGRSPDYMVGYSRLFLYLGSTPITLIPLVLFSKGVGGTSLTTLGLLQYIEPSVHFVIAVFVFGEEFDNVKAVSFSFIWLGLLLCGLEVLVNQRKTARKQQISQYI